VGAARGNAIEPMHFNDPTWARAGIAHARGRTGAKALLAWDGRRSRLIGLCRSYRRGAFEPAASRCWWLGKPMPT